VKKVTSKHVIKESKKNRFLLSKTEGKKAEIKSKIK
jgi:hypothetical protein